MGNKAMQSEEFKYDYDLKNLQTITPKNKDFKMLITPRYLHHYVKNAYEDFTADLLLSYSKENMLFIDIGAHYGFYSLLVAAQHKNSKVLAFEPVPENYEVLKRNVEQNKLQNIDVYNLGVSNHDEIKVFNITEASDNCGFYQHPLAKTIETIKIKTVALDNFLNDKLKIPTIIKIDTDGHEICILEGMKNILKSTKEIKLIVEFNPKMLRSAGFEPEHLLKKLSELGFGTYFIDDQQRKTYKLDQNNINNWGRYVGNESYINILCTKKGKSLSVCFFSHSSHLAGAERSLLELVAELIRDHGVICSVILPDDGPLRKKLEAVGASTLAVNYNWWCDLSLPTEEALTRRLNDNFETVLGRLMGKVEKINPDIIFTNTMVIPWGAVIASFLNKPHVWSIREYGHNFSFYLPLQDILDIIKNSSNIVMTNSNTLKKALFGDASDPNILTIGQYIDIPQNAIDSDKSDCFTKTAATKLLIAGTVTESKGQKDAVLAVKELVKRKHDVELIIAGYSDARYLGKLRNLVKEEKLEEYVRFIGFKENVYPIINQTDILLICSRNEAFGRTIIEAMLLGKPVVGTDSGGTFELIKEGFNGLLYEPGDYSQLADKIEYLMKNKDKIKEFGENGNKYAKEHFTKEEYGGRTYKILMDVKNTKNPSLTSYWQFVVSNMLHALSNLEAPQISHLEGLGREQAVVLNNIYNSYAWKAMIIYYKIRDKLFPENTKRRLFAKFILKGIIKFIRLFINSILKTVYYLTINIFEKLEGGDHLTPPRSMIFVGDGDFKEIGEKYKKYFLELGNLKPDDRILDVGCGIGRMAVPLTRFLSPQGEYWGFDIVKKGIKWCQNHITPKYRNFHFLHCDVYNKVYNPRGKIRAKNYRFPFGDDSFDFVFLTSVFTHMLPSDMEHYLSEISRAMKPGSRCLITFFLLTEEVRYLIEIGSSTQSFKYEIDGCLTTNEKDPEAAIAYGQEFILRLFQKYDLKINKPIHYGSWCGRNSFLNYQDIIVATKQVND